MKGPFIDISLLSSQRNCSSFISSDTKIPTQGQPKCINNETTPKAEMCPGRPSDRERKTGPYFPVKDQKLHELSETTENNTFYSNFLEAK